ncbi:CubicO group peptidase (beta-lactamase class C family) [Trinickia symbiotica]|uniref:Beta-lactamase-related domain-containing protein n=1 Tax=Trinickia symbiotica TaxID=863227 RepID=A0A2N7WTA6_9BURK|nr:serine hydrolase domain-containing protein [Trinickia symbiotica]PMS32640.1 hypothetical protein C0Z20_26080 [Trinickia symbiotica]PPK41748.1 CubicO group peptidase (beta-lactamase class C family) [Trinickia symbiotica]
MDLTKVADLGFDVERLDWVRQSIRGDIATQRGYGVAMRVARRGEVVFDFLEGEADHETGRKLKLDDVFCTFSLMKQFTAVVALKLVEQGKIRLHQPIYYHMPEWKGTGKEQINLFHLLTHTAGIMMTMPEQPPEVLTNIEKMNSYAATRPLDAMPGERVNYSMMLAHSVIAQLCVRADGGKRSFGQILNEELLQPLGMTNTSLGRRDDLLERLCPIRTGYVDGANPLTNEHLENFNKLLRVPGGEFPAAAGMTTIDDLHRFTEMLRRGGELDGARILSPAMIEFLSRNHTGDKRNIVWDSAVATRDWSPFPANMGLGFFVRGEGLLPGPCGLLNSPRTFGGFGAGSTGFWVDPGYDLSISFLSSGLVGSAHIERLGRLCDMIVGAIVK